MKPQRIQLSRRKGFKLPPDTVVVSRPSKWGNPFIVGKHGTQQECVRCFRLLVVRYLRVSTDSECVAAQQKFLDYAEENIQSLRGKNLACWCRSDQACHADVLLEIANA